MNPEVTQQLAHLEALAAELRARGLTAELRPAAARARRLHVTSPRPPALSEQVTCHQPPGQSWQFYWSSRQPIGPAADPAGAAATIATVLRPVHDTPATPPGETDHAAPGSGL